MATKRAKSVKSAKTSTKAKKPLKNAGPSIPMATVKAIASAAEQKERAELARLKEKYPDKPTRAPTTPSYSKSESERYVVREYDAYEHSWFDVTSAVTEKVALRRWNKETKNGTVRTRYDDGRYYAIFPADTRMLFSTAAGYDPDEGTWK